MLRKLYLFSFFLISFILIQGHDSYGQNKNRRKDLRHKNRKISSFTGKGAKFDKRRQYNGLGINLSSMNYFGDITPSPKLLSTDIQFSRPQIGITYMRRIGTRYSLRGSFSWGRIQGDDYYSADKEDNNARFRYVRNLHFRNDIKELSLVGMVDLLENRGNYLRRVDITPYVFGGVAVFHHNPKAKTPEDSPVQPGKWVALQPLGTEGQGWLDGANKKYSRVQLSLPIGVGLRYRLSDNFDLSFEVGYRYTFTDYLDDVSGNFVQEDLFTDELTERMADRSLEPINARTGAERDAEVIQNTAPNGYSYAAGNKRGTPNKDVYIVTGFHLTYVFVGNGIFGGNRRNAKFR
ncbi:MAG TPA: DUF6089 family protein [Cytophagales bacterium]|nr:DUF6089 family protein [Cytophagales bacterium]